MSRDAPFLGHRLTVWYLTLTVLLLMFVVPTKQRRFGMKPITVILVLVASLFLIATPLIAQPTPSQEKLVYENQFVKVYEATLHPHEKLPPHHGGNRVIYYLNDCSLLYHWDGRMVGQKRKAGEVCFHPEGVHAEENAGKANARFIIVERQHTPLPQPNGSGVDMAVANPHNTRVIFDRDMAKVFELSLAAKDVASMHFAPERLVYAPRGGQIVINRSDGTKEKESLKKGEYRWLQSGLQSLENASLGSSKLIVFAFKK
jgi:hypothetical protein